MFRLRNLVAVGAALLAALGTARAASTDVIQYQGRLVDSNGTPREGTVARIVFRLYSSATGSPASFVWGEAHVGVECRRGVFTVLLGAGAETLTDSAGTSTPGPNPFAGELADNADRFLSMQVTVNPGDPLGAEIRPFVRLGSVPFAVAAGGEVAIGGVIDWYRPRVGDPVPDGWVICDGATIHDPASAFNDLASPDLRGKFIRGIEPTTPLATSFGADGSTDEERLPDAGGQAVLDLAHSHQVLPHTHDMTHTHPGHTHGMSHIHVVDGVTGTVQQPAGTDGSSSYQGGLFIHNHSVGLFTGGSSRTETGVAGPTDGPSSTTTGGASNDGTDTRLSTFDNAPPYVGLLKIMRVR